MEDNNKKNSRYALKYYNKNKEQILNKNKEVIVCDCGSSFSRNCKSRHLKSKKHRMFTGDIIAPIVEHVVDEEVPQ